MRSSLCGWGNAHFGLAGGFGSFWASTLSSTPLPLSSSRPTDHQSSPPQGNSRPCLLVSGPLLTMLSSVQFSRSVVSDSLQPHESQDARPPCPSPTPGLHSDSYPLSVMPSSHLILCRPLLLLPRILPSIRVFSNKSTLPMRSPKYWSLASASAFQRNPRADLLQNGLVGSPCRPRDSQEFSPTPQFKSINSSVLSFLHSPTLTSIHDYWKNHSLD